VMYLIVNDYCDNPPDTPARWTINSLADHLDLPGAALGPIVTAMENKGLLIVADDDTWLPGRDPALILLADVLNAVRQDDSGPRLGRIRDIAPAVTAAKRAEQALRESLEGKTVKDLVSEKPE